MPSVEADLDMDSGPQQKSGGDAEELEFYKTQIQQLEDELQDFQASSKELEHELEKELEASEKVHRELRQKNEALKYEVEEWKVGLVPSTVNGEILCILLISLGS